MFETDKPLEEMTIEELELTRRIWKAQGEHVIFPLIIALAIGWKAETRTERTRRFYDTRSGQVVISTYEGKHHFDPGKGDYFHFLNIQIKAGNEAVANLVFDFYTQSLTNGSWMQAAHLFARPCDIDWVSEIIHLCKEWETQNEQGIDQQRQIQRNKLLNILEKGVYA